MSRRRKGLRHLDGYRFPTPPWVEPEKDAYACWTRGPAWAKVISAIGVLITDNRYQSAGSCQASQCLGDGCTSAGRAVEQRLTQGSERYGGGGLLRGAPWGSFVHTTLPPVAALFLPDDAEEYDRDAGPAVRLQPECELRAVLG